MVKYLIRDDGVVFVWSKNLVEKGFKPYSFPVPGGEKKEEAKPEETEPEPEPEPEDDKQIELDLPSLQPEEHVQTPSMGIKKIGRPKGKKS